MKKIIPFLVFLFILSACSNWKYGGKTKVSGNEVQYKAVVIDKKEKQPLTLDLATPESEDLTLIIQPAIQKETKDADSKALKLIVKPTLILDDAWIPIQDKLVEVDDSLKKNEEIYKQALKNEKEGRKSTAFGILSIALSFTPAVIAGLIFGVKGLRRSTRILDERYITPRGLKAANNGKILSIIGIVLSALIILSVIALIVLFITLY